MLPTILSQLRAENFSSALKKLATSGGWFISYLCPGITGHLSLNNPLVGTTVFRSKFFQIPQASLPNSAAHQGQFSTYSN